MATHSSVLAWRIPGVGEPGGLTSMGSHRVRHDWSDLAAAAAVHNPDFLIIHKMIFMALKKFKIDQASCTSLTTIPLFFKHSAFFLQGGGEGLLWHSVQFSSVQSLSRVRLFATPWIAARQAFLSITNSQSSLKLIGSPCSPRDSQESSPTPQFKSINSSALSHLHSSTLTSIHDHRKNHSLD